jgi:hypothetical protein
LPISPLLVKGRYRAFARAVQLGLYTQADYTAITLEGVPSNEYLLPGSPAFPKGGSTEVAIQSKDPVRSHIGLILSATPVASRLLLSFPAMLTLLQAIPRLGKPYPSNELHFYFSPFTLFLAAVLIAAFGQLGSYPQYSLTSWGGLVLHVTPKQLRALHRHYGAQGEGVKSLNETLRKQKFSSVQRNIWPGSGPERSLRFMEDFLRVRRVCSLPPTARRAPCNPSGGSSPLGELPLRPPLPRLPRAL